MNRQTVAKSLLYTSSLAFFCFLHSLGKKGDLETYPALVRSAYKGVVVEKYRRKGEYIKIHTSDSTIDMPLMSNELQSRIQVGDSIEKIALKNECILKRGNSNVHLSYVFIPNSIRDDSRWPKDLTHILASE